MGKQLDKYDTKPVITEVPLYDNVMYYRIYKSLLGADMFLSRCLSLVLIFIPLVFFIMLCKVTYLNSISIVWGVVLGVILFILLLVGVLVVVNSSSLVRKELKNISKVDSLSKSDFIEYMNNLLESTYPVNIGTDKYYMSSSLTDSLSLKGVTIIDKSYYIVKRYDKYNVVDLIGLYVGGYKIRLSDMAYRIKRPQFNELLSLHETDLGLWESKVSEIINR